MPDAPFNPILGFVQVVSDGDVASGNIPEGYEPLWRVPDRAAWYCVPKRAAEEIRLAEAYAEQRVKWASALKDMEGEFSE